VLLRKTRVGVEVYNDIEGEVVNLFRVLRDAELGPQLVGAIELTPFAREEFEAAYEPTEDPLEQARRTVVRSFMGYGSVSSSGEKTGFRATCKRARSHSAKDWSTLPNGLAQIVDRLRGVVIENNDAFAVCKAHDGPKTLHYIDPPYVTSTRRRGSQYCRKGYRFEMHDEDHALMACWIRQLRGMVVVSGYDCDLYRELFDGWKRFDRDTFSIEARKRTESIWLSPNALEALA
jgi:DNA adenine methylase